MKLAELMEQSTVTLTAGDYLVANTAAVGYLPTHKDTNNLHSGRYIFKIVAGGGTGKFNIIPVNLSADRKSHVEDPDNPIIVVAPTQVTYVTTRNDPERRDVYRSVKTKTETGIPAGQEARHALAAFIAFANSEYSLGVQHFEVAGPDYLDA